MRAGYPSPCLLFIISLLCSSHLVSALVTLGTMRNLTEVTDECRERIVRADAGGVGMRGMEMEAVGQVVLGRAGGVGGVDGDGDGTGDEGEVEDTITAALRTLCSDLLVELEKPLDSSSEAVAFPTHDSLFCRITIREYHHFLEATVKFLHEIQERQMLWHWSAESGVFDAMTWLQGLWASRKANSQNRSFIEQQMAFYSATGCFGKDQEVLKRDVEVVEYMNDLIDSFQ